MTLEQHLSANRDLIESEAREYARVYKMPLERARREIEGEFAQGWHEDQDDARYE